jgi:hypothetical protein
VTKTRQEADETTISTAESFVASAYRGLGRYDIVEAASLEAARREADRLYIDRPVMIYAISGRRQVHVENRDPQRLIA